jgi:hypothetical protein
MSHLISELPPHIHDIIVDIHKSAGPSWRNETNGTHLLRACIQYCVDVDQKEENPAHTVFWEAITHRRRRGGELLEKDECLYWLGFYPETVEEKRSFIDIMQKNYTGVLSTTDVDRNYFIQSYGAKHLPGYNKYPSVFVLPLE